MKKLFGILLIATCITMAANAQTSATANPKFDTENQQMGKVKQNVPVTALFTFTNTGTSPLIVEGVTAGCSCTVGDFQKTPVMPGKKSVIKATFNAHASGPFNKSVFVRFAGTKDVTTLSFAGEVEAAATTETVSSK